MINWWYKRHTLCLIEEKIVLIVLKRQTNGVEKWLAVTIMNYLNCIKEAEILLHKQKYFELLIFRFIYNRMGIIASYNKYNHEHGFKHNLLIFMILINKDK